MDRMADPPTTGGAGVFAARSSHLHRSRVTTLLDSASTRPVTLVLGPVGAGKTTAVSDWAREGRAPGPVVWVTVEASRGPGERWSAAAHHLADALAGDAGPQVLVLDDVHHVDADDTAALLLDRLLRRPPPGLHLVLVGRREPDVPLNRLRFSGALTELRFADLAFTVDEVEALLHAWQAPVAPGWAGQVLGVTAGWAAIVRVMAERLCAAADPVAALAALDEGDPALTGYLWEEVLPTFSATQRAFLTRTCVVERFSRGLAVELVGDPDAVGVLEALRAEDVLTPDPADRDWFATHPLVRQAVRSRLRREDARLEERLHARAAVWLEEAGQRLAALGHAIDSGDWDLAGPVAVRTSAVVLLGSGRAELVSLLERLPAGLVAAHSELQVALAHAAYCRNDDATVWLLAAQARVGLATLPPDRHQAATLALTILEACQAHREGNAALLAASARQGLEVVRSAPAAARSWGEYLAAPVMFSAIAELWLGRPESALQQFDAVRTSHPAPAGAARHDFSYYLANVALAQGLSGRMAEARRTAARALELAAGAPPEAAHRDQEALLALSLAAMAACDGPAARAALDRAAAASTSSTSPLVTALLAALTAAQHADERDLPAARAHLARVERILRTQPSMTAVAQLTAAIRVRVELASNAPDRAADALDAFSAAGTTPAPAIALARASVLLATGRAAEVPAVVADVLEGRGYWSAAAWMDVCEAHDRLRLDSKATHALAEALDRAEPEDAVAPFVGRGRRLGRALQRHLDVVGTNRAFVERVIAADASAGASLSPALAIPAMRGTLTERELSVLAYLATMGSNDEIAASLSISPNTVKQHLKSIFHKLGVGSRREAVRVARDRGLLTPAGEAPDRVSRPSSPA